LIQIVVVSEVWVMLRYIFFFSQAEDGIRDDLVTGVQTCALPICFDAGGAGDRSRAEAPRRDRSPAPPASKPGNPRGALPASAAEIGRASCRERVWVGVGAVLV